MEMDLEIEVLLFASLLEQLRQSAEQLLPAA